MALDSKTGTEILAELGTRLRRLRLQQNVTQAALAKKAGISLRTLQSLEAGGDAQMSTLVRVLRALGRVDALEAFLPPPRVSPIELLETAGKGRQRARGKRGG